MYDRGGEQAIKEGGVDREFHNPMDIFDMFFGGGGRRNRGPTKGKDVIHQLKVSLEDLYNGTTRKLALQKSVICSKCDGECSHCQNRLYLLHVIGHLISDSSALLNGLILDHKVFSGFPCTFIKYFVKLVPALMYLEEKSVVMLISDRINFSAYLYSFI